MEVKLHVFFLTVQSSQLTASLTHSLTFSLSLSLSLTHTHTHTHTLTYLFTYLLTPWNRVLEKLIGSAASQEIPRILWNPKVHYRTHKCLPPAPILSQLHSVPKAPSHFLKVRLNVILSSMSGSPHWSPSLRLPHQNPVHTSPLPHMRHMPRPSHYSRFYHLQNIG